MARTYLEWLVALPWQKETPDDIDLARARAVLDEDHWGLGKIKDRLLEYLAVRKIRPEGKAPDPLLRGPAGRRQDVARPIDRPRPRPEVPPDRARRDAGRGGDPRPPADVHRRPARADRPGAAAGRVEEPGLHAGRDRQARLRFPGRPGVGAPRGAGPGAELDVPGPLPRRALRSLAGPVHHDREPAGPDPGAAPRPDGDHRAARVHRGREGRDRAAPPGAEAGGRARPRARPGHHVHGRGAPAPRPELHARGGRAEPRAGDRRALPEDRPAARRGGRRAGDRGSRSG